MKGGGGGKRSQRVQLPRGLPGKGVADKAVERGEGGGGGAGQGAGVFRGGVLLRLWGGREGAGLAAGGLALALWGGGAGGGGGGLVEHAAGVDDIVEGTHTLLQLGGLAQEVGC